jgi:hypothetical protein
VGGEKQGCGSEKSETQSHGGEEKGKGVRGERWERKARGVGAKRARLNLMEGKGGGGEERGRRERKRET